jgi:hypothetical protein
MLFNRRKNKLRKRQSAWLYSTVFNGSLSTLSVFFLLVSFTIQPFHKVIASENEPDIPVIEELVAEDVTLQTEPLVDESPPDLSEEDEPPAEIIVEESISESETTDPTLEENPEGDVTEDELPPVEITEVPLGEEPTVDSPEESLPVAEPLPSVVEFQSLITEENFFQFSKQSCVAVGNGAYHCTNKDTEEINTQSVVQSKQGPSGNMEIYLQTNNGNERQITDNVYDDTAPHYDPESMRLVWHRLIDGRYQIVLYDIMEDKESQLTFSKTNNMEPKVSDGGIVWQAWDGNDWEIMLFDGSYTEQLTSNDSQDVTPVIQDGYVLWNVLGALEQQARVYSLDTKETVSIEGHEGGSIVNPRFVLVYDTQFENGDIVTQSFDPATGLSQPITATPAPEPINVPEPDPTGEIRALLLQGKNQKEEGEITDISGDGGGSGVPLNLTSPGTLNLNQPVDIALNVVMQPVATSTDFELTEYDLVIPENALNNALLNTQ